LLAGVLKPQAGERELGHNVKSGYYSQYRVDMLNPDRTVLDEAMDSPHAVTEFVRTVLGCFLFRGDDVFKKVSVLSGGEKSRLALVKLLLDPPNLLLMDEPTTHLDMPSIEALIAALEQFVGTLIFISHDVYFIRQLSSHVVRVEGGQLNWYSGGYQYYLDKTAAAAVTAPVISAPREKPRTKEQKRAEAEERQARYQKRKVHQEAVEKVEKEIQRLEARQKELTAGLENPEKFELIRPLPELTREWEENANRLQVLAQEWERAATKLEEAGV
jgi:ATP-binding cassette subfamily F protein 3